MEKQQAEAARQVEQQLAEAQKAREALQAQLAEAQKAQAELEARKQAEAVDKAIMEATTGLKYGDAMNKLFVEAVRAAKPGKPEDVTAIVEAKRKEYDQLAAAAKLVAMGKTGVQVMGPVFERETGQPEFTRWPLR